MMIISPLSAEVNPPIELIFVSCNDAGTPP